MRRHNLGFVTDDTLALAVGNFVQLLDLRTGAQSHLPGLDGKGIGCVAVHPQRTCFAVAEKGANPNVYIYEWPSLKLKRMLPSGTERAFSCAAFSPDGKELATVGGYPDFWLTVWDWDAEAITLRAKAFSQEVPSVTPAMIAATVTPAMPAPLATRRPPIAKNWASVLSLLGRCVDLC